MRILVIDDDVEMCAMLERLLEAEGYEAQSVSAADQALDSIIRDDPDLVLLDVNLDSLDGRDLLREIRLICDVPVVFLTGRASEIDRISGLKMGADDYVVKPFSPGELSARVASILRRTHRAAIVRDNEDKMVFGDLSIDTSSREVFLGGVQVTLTAKEFDLLAFLAAEPRRVFSRQQLLTRVWDSSSAWQDEATVTEHIRRIRHKIESAPDHPRWIVTVRGVGYRFEPI